jgi:hypothetical protein
MLDAGHVCRMTESDWKLFRELRTVALERFCERVLSDIARITSDSRKTQHERYLEVFAIVRGRDRDLAAMFDNPRRSTALDQLSMMLLCGLVTGEELLRFSPKIHESVSVLASARI